MEIGKRIKANRGAESFAAWYRTSPTPVADGNIEVVDELTPDSKAEQMSAGLHMCSKVEYERFQALNEAYKAKFGFPFVMAVRGSNCDEILGEFSRRLRNDYDEEFESALAEIHKIARFRLEALEGGA